MSKGEKMLTATDEESIKAGVVSDAGEVVVYMKAYGGNEWQEAGVPINYAALDYVNRIGQFLDYVDATDPDVTFLVGPAKTRIRAHRIILTAHSPVFRSMFFGCMQCEPEVKVPDCSVAAFSALVTYCYKQRCSDLTVERATEYLYTAKKYLATGFEEHCTLYFTSTLEPGHVFDVLKMAEFYVLPQLSTSCWEYIQEHAEAVLTMHLEHLSLETFLEILAQQELNIPETTLFKLTLEWAKQQCRSQGFAPSPASLRKVAGKAFKLLRIPTMTGLELATLVAPTQIFTDEEMTNFFISTHTPEFCKKPKLEYSALPRRAKPELSVTDLGLEKFKLRKKFIRLLTELVVEMRPEIPLPVSISPGSLADWIVDFAELQEDWFPSSKHVMEYLGDLTYEL